jgi:aspartate carbamoyltransferase catalytic subunit
LARDPPASLGRDSIIRSPPPGAKRGIKRRFLFDLADGYVALNRQAEKKHALSRGRTIVDCFFDNSTRTRTSFELAGKRRGETSCG